ncbi:hypothetical protein F2P81_020114 [Scophthalmus maximus]|uniref:Uncharacterized protein n=1 Tax=Scophthalmus maximus TaxID=52904 RepID=A0A6A4RZ89_SCOMX|nr:hypothetical protein F2P81_020114 [Scophthalmus maximus]
MTALWSRRRHIRSSSPGADGHWSRTGEGDEREVTAYVGEHEHAHERAHCNTVVRRSRWLVTNTSLMEESKENVRHRTWCWLSRFLGYDPEKCVGHR